MKWLLWRSYMAGIRNRVHTYDALVKTFVPAIVLGLLYFNLAHRNPSRLYETNVNALLIVIIYVSATTCGTLISGTVPNAIFVFLKETQQHMYGTLVFYIQFILYILPYLSPFYYGYSILNKLQWDNGSSSAVIYFDITMLFLLFTVFNILAFIVIWWGAHRFHIAEKWQTIIEKQTIN
ncbi:unnamed protein product [Adineta steineri]|uniref:Uncharacterized protein n=2 Tax=Adineta steineri TaxID=433720 RepID=A0A813Y1W9_9BILA|nr:unnamed protein product [Adineta steineri]